MNRTLLVVVFPFAAAGLGAQTIPVSGGGASLALAVASAPDGAVLVVAPGTYYPFVAAQRRLTLVAPQRATIRYAFMSSSVFTLTVSGISAALPFRMVGFDVLAGSIPYSPYSVFGGVVCADAHLESFTCQGVSATGSLVLADCTISGPRSAALQVDNANVALTDSSFVGGLLFGAGGTPAPAPGIQARGSNLRAERIQVQAASVAGVAAPALRLDPLGGVECTATIADSSLLPGVSSPLVASISCTPATTLTVSGSQTPGGITCAHATTALATLRWLTRQWTPGGASVLRSQHQPVTLAIAVVSLSVVPFTSPLFAEQSFVGAGPDWIVHAFGVSNALAEFDWNLALPPSPALLYAEAWLHGVSMPGFPLHVSTPLGGLIR